MVSSILNKKMSTPPSTPPSAPLNAHDIKRYSRQLLVPQFGIQSQSSLRDARVLLVGAGGLGSSAALYLAGAGVGTIQLVDGDQVERSNLHRQIIHTEQSADDHQYKVVSAAAAMTSINGNCVVLPESVFLTCKNVMDFVTLADVVVDGTDNVSTRYILSDACVLAGKPLVSGAAIGMDGQATVYNYAKKKTGGGGDGSSERGLCYRCRFPAPPTATQSCSDAGVLGPVPGMIGVMLAMETIKIISGVGQPLSERLYHYDALEGRAMVFQLPGKRATCESCGDDVGDDDDDNVQGDKETEEKGKEDGDKIREGSKRRRRRRIRTIEDTRLFLEEHQLPTREESSTMSMSTSTSCSFSSSSRKDKDDTPLSANHCISCSEYNVVREREKKERRRTRNDDDDDDGVDDDDQLSSSHHILLDVRSAHQYAICSLSGSRNIPLFDLPASMEQLKEMEKQEGTRELFVICRRGVASVKATKLLLEFGLSNVKNVTGGLDAWHAEVDPTLPMY